MGRVLRHVNCKCNWAGKMCEFLIFFFCKGGGLQRCAGVWAVQGCRLCRVHSAEGCRLCRAECDAAAVTLCEGCSVHKASRNSHSHLPIKNARMERAKQRIEGKKQIVKKNCVVHRKRKKQHEQNKTRKERGEAGRGESGGSTNQLSV